MAMPAASTDQGFTTEPVMIATDDGATLSGSMVRPAGAPERMIVVHGATGVPHAFYARFAEWLATTHSAVVLTYDYRDFGASGTGPLRQSRATMADWGIRDQEAAFHFLADRAADLPIWIVGHSLGGMYVAFHRGAERVERLITIACGPAHWTTHPWHYMPSVILFWWLIGPLATRLFGYLPGRLIGLGADLPAGVYWQWRRWCVSRGFNRGDWGGILPLPDFARITGQVTMVAVADDALIPPSCVRLLADFYPQARIDQRVIEPASIGRKAIGHIGILSPRNAAAWPMILA